MRFFCRTCPYIFKLKCKVRHARCFRRGAAGTSPLHAGSTKACDAHGEQVTSEATLEQKVVDDVLGGQDAWKNADQTEGAFAPECHCTCREDAVRRWWGVGDCA